MGSFPRSPTTESPCLPLCSLAFIFVIACYKTSHRTAEDIFLNCESDCISTQNFSIAPQALRRAYTALHHPSPAYLSSPTTLPLRATHQLCLGTPRPDLYLWSQCNYSECPTLKSPFGHLAKLNSFLLPNLSVLSLTSRLLYMLSLLPGKSAPSPLPG